MSSFHGTAIHPVTKRPTRCMWLDDYFGRRRYGVRFEGEEYVYEAKGIRPAEDVPVPEER